MSVSPLSSTTKWYRQPSCYATENYTNSQQNHKMDTMNHRMKWQNIALTKFTMLNAAGTWASWNYERLAIVFGWFCGSNLAKRLTRYMRWYWGDYGKFTLTCKSLDRIQFAQFLLLVKPLVHCPHPDFSEIDSPHYFWLRTITTGTCASNQLHSTKLMFAS